MATAYPDLANARAAVERLMVDTLVITRDAQGTEDDTLDLTTGLLTSPAPVTIYDGPGKFKTAQRQTNQVDEGGRYLTVTVYECAIPAESALPQVGDRVLIADSVRDLASIGKLLEVTEVMGSTMLVSRKFSAEQSTAKQRARPS